MGAVARFFIRGFVLLAVCSLLVALSNSGYPGMAVILAYVTGVFVDGIDRALTDPASR